MSGRSWQPGPEYWTYLPNNLSSFVPAAAPTSLNPRERTRDPWRLFEERIIGGPNYGLASFPAATPSRPSVSLLLIDDYRTYPTTPPNQASSVEESRLSPEEQKQALNKLRKQLYSPHLNRIIKRLGNNSVDNDDDAKRCVVCLEDFETKQYLSITPCDHMFHEECIVPWVKSQGKCPVCRFVMIEKDPPQRTSNAANPTSRHGVGIQRNVVSLTMGFNH